MIDFQQRYITARKAVIAKDFTKLNSMQRKAAMTTEGPLLLLAGAGSGKTTVLIQRIYNLLTYGQGSDCDSIPENATEDDLQFLEHYPDNPDALGQARARQLCAVNVPKPWQIIAITFTNKAAGELKDRLTARLGPAANDVWASTFHSACVRILRRDIDRLGFGKDFTIYDADDSRRLLRDIVKEMNLDEKAFPAKSILPVISGAKDRYESPQKFAEHAEARGDWRLTRIAKVYAAYAKRLCSANALDFDDLIYHTVTLLRQEPEVREYYQQKFRYVLVDEYQDTNHLQYLLTSLLVGGRKNLCVVGDDDQSIYRFRGANIENILNFEEQYPTAQVIRLEQNYRSTQNILDAANAVIQNNINRKGKALWTDNGSGEPITVRTTLDESDEANYVVGDILSSIRCGRHFRDAAVLYRMNAQSNALEYALKRNGIPYKIVGGMKFFDRAEVKDMLAYLCLLNNPLDDLRLQRVINTPVRGIGAVTMDKVTALALEQGASLYEIIHNADLFPELKSAAARLIKFADLIDGLRKAGASMTLPEFYDEVCDRTGYVKALKDKKDLESQGRIENIQELKSNIIGFLEQDPDDATLSGFLNEIALYTDLDGMETESDCVTLMTIHSAKGLEFSTVYVVGMEEGIFPSSSALYDEDGIEEERRLCYVAMTRAKDKLTLTNCRQRMLYGRTSPNPVSRFLKEIPENDRNWTGRPDMSHEGPKKFESPAARTSIHQPRSTAETKHTRPYKVLPSASQQPAAPLLELSMGDQVEHDAFGRGTVLDVQPTSNDAIVIVQFDGISSPKRLMLKYAGNHLKKI